MFSRVVLAGALAALVTGCGGENAPGWPGPPTPLPASGSLPTEEFDRYLEAVDEPWEQSVIGVATAYALPLVRDASGLATSRVAEGRVVTVTIPGLADDSIQDLRVVLRLASRGETFGVETARWSQRCRPGRGHADFSPAPCL